MKVILILIAMVLMAVFSIICLGKIMNPPANQDLEIPWDFPALAALLVAAFVIICNQEDILHHLKNKQ
jgi:hypothetical protein